MTPINNLPLDVLSKIVTESKNPQCFNLSKYWNKNIKEAWIKQASIPFNSNQKFAQLNPNEKFRVLKNTIFNDGINHQHFQEIAELENCIPNAPEETDLYQFINLFQKYADFNAISATQSKEQTLKNLKQWIDRIQNRLDGIGIPKDKEKKEIYYTQLEKILKHIIINLKQRREQAYVAPNRLDSQNNLIPPCPQQIPHQIEKVDKQDAEILVSLGIAMSRGGAHVMVAAMECYTKLYSLGNSFENQLKQQLHMLRREILREIVLEIQRSNIEFFRAHYFLNLIHEIGVTRGILGGITAQYEDPYSRNINMDIAYNKFDSKYTRDKIIEFAKNYIQITNKDLECAQWFKDHIPIDWKDRPLKNAYKDYIEQFLFEFVFDSDYAVRTEAIVYMLKEMHILFYVPDDL